MRRGVESFTYNLSNHLAEFYNLKIIIYTWSNNNPINWGKWHKRIKIRKVPYSRYYQTLIAKIFYWFWIKLDQENIIICNFLWHGETAVFNRKKDILIFHNPAMVPKNRITLYIIFFYPHTYHVFRHRQLFSKILTKTITKYLKR